MTWKGARDIGEALEDFNSTLTTLQYVTTTCAPAHAGPLSHSHLWLATCCCSMSFNDIHIRGVESFLFMLLFNTTLRALRYCTHPHFASCCQMATALTLYMACSVHGNSVGDCECSYCKQLGRGDVIGDLVAASTSLTKLDIGGGHCVLLSYRFPTPNATLTPCPPVLLVSCRQWPGPRNSDPCRTLPAY